MTDAERKTLNERVALRLGWTKNDSGKWWNEELYIDEEFDDAPDFTREWEHAGPLWEKMWNDAWASKDIGTLIDEIEIIQTKVECDLTEAITIVFDAWIEGEES